MITNTGSSHDPNKSTGTTHTPSVRRWAKAPTPTTTNESRSPVERGSSGQFSAQPYLVRGLIALMNTPHEVTGPMSLGNPVEFSMLELPNLVIELTESKYEIASPAPAGLSEAAQA